MPTVYDLNGKALERFDDFASPHAIGFAGIIRGSHDTYLHDRWDEALADSRENALMMRNDCWLKALCDERARGVTSSKWELEIDNPADPWQVKARDGLLRAVKRTPNLKRLLRKCLEATWYGRYANQIKWQWENIAGEKMLRIEGHTPVNGDKIGFQFDGTPYVLINAGEAQQLGAGAQVISTTIHQALLLKGGWRERWLIHKHDPEDADFFEEDAAAAIHGVGIRSRIYWLDYLRKEFCSWVIEALERSGLGIVVIKYEQGNDAAKTQAETLAKTYSRRSVITFPVPPGTINGRIPGGAYGIEVVETPTAGIEILEQLQRNIEDKIERYIIGQSASSKSETSGMGTHNTDFQQLTKQELIAADAEELADTLTGSPREPGLLSTILRWSYPWADFPVRWVFKIGDPFPEKKLEAASRIAAMGGYVKADEVLEFAGLSKVTPGDEAIGGPQQQQAPDMGGTGATPDQDRSAAAKKGWEHRGGQLGQSPDQGSGKPGGSPNRIAALLNGQSKQFERSGSPLFFESHHAPKDGINIAGKQYVGGEFIPGDQVAKASASEKKQLTVKRNMVEQARHAPKALAEALSRENIEKTADALLNGARHPVATAGKALEAAKAKLRSVYDEYGAVGVAAVASAYVAYYTAAAANPAMLTVPVPLTATILTCARLVKGGIKAIKGKTQGAAQ